MIEELESIRQAVLKAQSDHRQLFTIMPNKAETEGQRRLQKLHGTPLEFSVALSDAIGEISVDEACDAARKYRDEWGKA